ncbi:hypothetical protein [Parasphingorhabdus cellanae]|uniref:Uncharacterized protein n=1 Tax=Parasphingorhabdus cellanae TaxID=2806553 RepID=A0ABX7T3V7_9SPHN|nr:hypothetical protein [Parasphingorhabdus cellanae]QTD56259.1 hypothetical protein J4G78_01240 [Parasphingorhabdus cellanae]
MFNLFTIALLSAASTGAADAETMRVTYSNCLTDFTITHLDQKTARGSFKKAAAEACPDERSAMIAAIKKDEMEFDSSQEEAMQFATEEADSVLTAFTDGYAGYLSSSTRPVKQ